MLTLDEYTFTLIKRLIKYERLNYSDDYITTLQLLLDYGLDFEQIAQSKIVARNFFKRLQTCRTRVKSILLNGDSYFYTFTFNDEFLTRTNFKTRRFYITKILGGSNYVANVDFGKKNGREHYHALSDVLIENYNFGFFKVDKVRLEYDEIGNCSTLSRLSKYVAKLSNHALKDSTGRCKLLYSRKKL